MIYEELILKTKRGRIEFAWLEGADLAIDAENSDERVQLFLNPAQVEELFRFLKLNRSSGICAECSRITKTI